MEKEKITFEDLALMSFLKFGRLDGIDMTVLMNFIANNFEIVLDDVSNDYFIMNDGTIMLNNSYVDNFCKNINNDMIEEIQKTKVYKQMDKINVIEFILRKIKIMGDGAVLADELDKYFDSLQIRMISRLYLDGFINEYFHKDSIYGDYSAIKLTKRGDLYLYVIDNRKHIDNFSNILRETGCDESLIPSFLIAQDLDRNIEEFLTVNNFMNFCHEYGLSIFKNADELKRKKTYK